ncbi:MAG TPA: type IV toxin-antitoxin system AbiEi family antitoxin [Actinomycetes bacterium]|nr:type IV toxin-antitoxin system AbiEi family antitoxin [Actinomycetes bacterium]
MLPRDPFTTADATAAGYSPLKISVLVATGSWVALRRGVYCTAERLQAGRWTPRSEHVLQIQAALLGMRRPAVVSGWSAALLSGLPLPVRLHGRAPEHVTLTTSTGHSRHLSGVRLLVAPLPADQVVADPEAPTTTPARTAVDLAVRAADAERPDVLAVLDAVLNTELASKAQLHEIARLFGGRPGGANARALIDLADGRSESPLESHSRAFFAATDLPMPEAQVEIRDDHGRLVGRVDFLWREQRTVGEADGRLKYGSIDVLYREKQREDRLRELGFEVVRWDATDLRHNPAATAARIRAAFARGAQLGPR